MTYKTEINTSYCSSFAPVVVTISMTTDEYKSFLDAKCDEVLRKFAVSELEKCLNSDGFGRYRYGEPGSPGEYSHPDDPGMPGPCCGDLKLKEKQDDKAFKFPFITRPNHNEGVIGDV